MTGIPTTSTAFDRFCADHNGEWPIDLQELAVKAYRALWRIDNNPPHIINHMEESGHPAWRSDINAIVEFAEAYGAWKAKQ